MSMLAENFKLRKQQMLFKNTVIYKIVFDESF